MLVLSTISCVYQVEAQESSLVIDAPSSVIEGRTFQVHVTDQNGNPIQGAEVTLSFTIQGEEGKPSAEGVSPPETPTDSNGTTQITAPRIPSGSIIATLTVYKQGYLPGETQILIEKGDFFLDAPYMVIEGTTFPIYVTDDNGNPIQGAEVLFTIPGDQPVVDTYYTDSAGTAQITAPPVQKDTTAMITAWKNDNIDETEILIQNSQGNLALEAPSSVIEGKTFQVRVTDDNGNPIQGAQVTLSIITPPAGDNPGMGEVAMCDPTDNTGTTWITAPTVNNNTVATITASKRGYSPDETDILIVNEEGKKDYQQFFTDYAINQVAEEGMISGKIDVRHPVQQEGLSTMVTTYNTPLSITIESATAEKLSIVVAGPEGTTGKIITVRFGPGTLDDMNNVSVLYDNEFISRVSFDAIFQGGNDTNATAKWTSVLAVDSEGNQTLYCLIRIPHFSEHTITISSIAKVVAAIGGITAVILYITVIGVVALIYVVPIWYFQKKP
jgi:uncharacterized GH25 family protein